MINKVLAYYHMIRTSTKLKGTFSLDVLKTAFDIVQAEQDNYLRDTNERLYKEIDELRDKVAKYELGDNVTEQFEAGSNLTKESV